MKRISFVFMGLILWVVTVQGQSTTVKKDAKGNYIEQSPVKSNQGKKTTKIYKDSKGNKYVVYQEKNGKLFIWTKDKRGKFIKTYINK